MLHMEQHYTQAMHDAFANETHLGPGANNSGGGVDVPHHTATADVTSGDWTDWLFKVVESACESCI
jgi:hypothetical protein